MSNGFGACCGHRPKRRRRTLAGRRRVKLCKPEGAASSAAAGMALEGDLPFDRKRAMTLPRLPFTTPVVRIAAMAASVLMTACVVAPVARYPGGPDAVVMVAPPAPQVEVIGAMPGPGYFWIDGYWGWSSGRHIWNRGHWEAGRPGHRWTPQRWHRDGGGWRWAPGQWRRG